MADHTINGIAVVTNFEHPPIPARDQDWSAVLAGHDYDPDAPGQPVGRGRTEANAIIDLLHLVDEEA